MAHLPPPMRNPMDGVPCLAFMGNIYKNDIINNSKLLQKIMKPQEVLKSNKTWVWCLYKHSEEEIEEKVFSDYNNICFAYICEFSSMSHAFAKRLALLSLGRTKICEKDNKMIPYITKDNINDVFEESMQIYDAINNNKDFKIPSKIIYETFNIDPPRKGQKIVKRKTKGYESFKKAFTDRLDWKSIVYTD